jgi:hypothetical protein
MSSSAAVATRGSDPKYRPVFDGNKLKGSVSLQPPRGLDTPMTETQKREYKDALAWFNEMVKKAKSFDHPLAIPTPVDITPGLARVLLERNENNRRVNRSRVEGYKMDLRGGRWAVNGETLKVSSDGTLNDGQHRLFAIIETGIVAKMFLVFGIKPEDRRTVDQGLARSTAGNLEMAGISDASDVAKIGFMIASYMANGGITRGGHSRPTRSLTYDTSAHYAGQIGEAISFLRNTQKSGKLKNVQNLGNISAYAFAYWLLCRATQKEDVVQSFFSGNKTGANLKQNDPRLVARNRLLSIKGTSSATEKVSILIRAWNAWVEGRELLQVRMVKAVGSVHKLPAISLP